jgi:hypothetical protein
LKRLFVVLSLLCATSFAAAKELAPVHRVTNSSDTYNFRFEPISLLVGIANVNFDVAMTPDWTVGPQLSYGNYSGGTTATNNYKLSVSTYGVGARATWFRNGVYTDGLYLAPSVTYQATKVSLTDTSGVISGEANGVFVTGLVGYGWFWESFNQMLGGGVSLGLGSTVVKVRDSSGNYSETSIQQGNFALEYSLGWTF